MPATNDIQQIEPPALPQATPQYNGSYMSQLLNVMRLYFSRVSTSVNGILATESGGAALYKPYFSAYDTSDQTTAGADTETNVVLGTTRVSKDIAVETVDYEDVTVDYKGVYRAVLSLNVKCNTASGGTCTAWVLVNGTDLAASAVSITFNDTGVNQLVFDDLLSLAAGDVLTFAWAATTTDIQLEATAASAPYPVIPSTKLVLSYTSNT